MARRAKHRRAKSHRRCREGARSGERVDPFEDVVEYGGELIFAVGFTPGGAPFGPRVEIVDGELHFLDDERLDLDTEP